MPDPRRPIKAEFWSDDISLLDTRLVDAATIHGPRQRTDTYLLALAMHHGGVFVTFDRALPVDAARGVGSGRLLVL